MPGDPAASPKGAPTGPPRGLTAGAAFLMATSAIGPGFLTQTAVFTGALRADFAFAILVFDVLPDCQRLA